MGWRAEMLPDIPARFPFPIKMTVIGPVDFDEELSVPVAKATVKAIKIVIDVS
jgi:hypothetical protein